MKSHTTLFIKMGTRHLINHPLATIMQPDTLPDQTYDFNPAPVAIGGVGGSGTRLIAAILGRLNFYMGSDLNPANDNLAFTLLFKQTNLWPLNEHAEQIRHSLRIFLNTMYLRQPLSEQDIRDIQGIAANARFDTPKEWLHDRANKLINSATAEGRPSRWGWKEPNTHIFLPTLIENIPNLKYIHVMRHGLDMAHSVNQAQLHYWGGALTGAPTVNGSPEESFRYWCAAHHRVVNIGKQMGTNFLLLNFDDFCREPETGIKMLLEFLNVKHSNLAPEYLLDMVCRPVSTGRHKSKPKVTASEGDIDTLRQFGFDYYQ